MPAISEISPCQLVGSGDVTTMERIIADYYSKKYCLAVCNATMALWALAKLKGSDYSNAICSPLTYGGSIAGFMHEGYSIDFADVEPSFGNIDVQRVKEKLETTGPSIVIGTDHYGYPHDQESVRRLCDEYTSLYIADVSQGFGSRQNDHPSGYSADIIVVSFSSGKLLSAGEGAAIVTNMKTVYEELIELTQHPYRQKKEIGLMCSNEFGLNMRIHPASASMIVHNYDAVLNLIEERRSLFQRVFSVLGEIGLTVSNLSDKNDAPNYYRCLVKSQQGFNVADTKTMLKERGFNEVSVSLYDRHPLYTHQSYNAMMKDHRSNHFCPIAEEIVKQLVVLDIIPKSAQQEDICLYTV